ncbi:aminotransferase class I/II-fold pyridoxal phosphate-dependent enzyme (plasmid) [Streptomyces sp. BI20]|uniref:aminotransferase class I/II-fold pyridoxal phosphate-dependent enzyme n=1 Tax=Streptomyces sp. BI20 TaxID=3403460 RepID=UPI003C712647
MSTTTDVPPPSRSAYSDFFSRRAGIDATANAYTRWRRSPANTMLGRAVPVGGATPHTWPDPDARPGDLLNISAQDYLGLSMRPEIARAVITALEAHGTGTGAAPMAGGSTPTHCALERELSAHCGMDDAAIFASGYAANVGLVAGLMRPGDTVVMDRNAHASSIDGARMAGAEVRVFRHNDASDLEAVLRQLPAGGERLVCLEGLYSMDGDTPDLHEMKDVAHRHGALLVVDEAHSEFCLGPTGGGLAELQGVKPDFHVGTFSKALSVQGGFIAGDGHVMQWLKDTARPRMFSVTVSPLLIGAVTEALRIARTEPHLRAALGDNSALLRARLAEHGIEALGNAHVVPVLVGDETACLTAARVLGERGVHVMPVLYPAVALGKARLRVTVCTTYGTTYGTTLIDDIAREVAHAVHTARNTSV